MPQPLFMGARVSDMSAEYRYKIVMLGDGAVGKTAMTTRFTQNHFDSDYKRTIGSDFAIKRLHIEDIDTQVTLQVWDLAGQPRFESVRQGFYRGSRGGLLLYDVTRRRTFLNVDTWKEEAFSNLQNEIPLVLVANKVDLKESRVVTTEEGEKYAKKNGFIYVESSALTGENVEEAYSTLCKRMIEDAKESTQTKVM
ncbi:MAG: GTP-binding protein [Candidatus Thorarchaeota archaeon]|nr:GTP-binding protein [Candidatus Thorarchaeota archaeon]